MSLFVLLAIYLTAAVSLAGGAVAALVILTSPVESEPSKPIDPKMASVDPAKHIIVAPRRQQFRYGPEVNHGRSDTPVYAAQQAIRQAKASAVPMKTKRQRLHQDQGAISGFAPSVPSSVPSVPSVPSSGH